MTLTHLSHFGLTEISKTADSVIFEGTLAACKRMAFAHGCEVASEQGRIMGSDGGKAIYNTSDITTYWLADQGGEHAGLIQKGRDGWNLVLGRRVWDAK